VKLTEIGSCATFSVTLADFVPSVTEVAFAVAEHEATPDGAVYVIAVPDADEVAESEPQLLAGAVGVSVQFTPFPATSPRTVAVNGCVPPSFTVGGLAGAMLTVNGVTVIVADAFLLGSSCETTVMVATQFEATVAAGVKAVDDVAEKRPVLTVFTAPRLPQLAGLTPQAMSVAVFASKPITVASGIAAELCPTVIGRVPAVEVIAPTEIGFAVNCIEADFVGSSFEDAVMVAVQVAVRGGSEGAM
jgi:hypothetical protein